MKSLVLLLLSLSMVFNVFSQAITSLVKDPLKRCQPKYCLFYDNHTMPACPDVGENFDAEAFTDRIKRCGVNQLTLLYRSARDIP